MNTQALIDGMNAQAMRDRAETQMTLGKLIAELEEMPEDTAVANLHHAHSYRGYYREIAFTLGNGTRPAVDLLAECRGAMGQVFEGYKGGEFVMGAKTPVWVACWGSCGKKLIALRPGELVTIEDD